MRSDPHCLAIDVPSRCDDDVTGPLQLARTASGCASACVVHRFPFLNDNGSSYVHRDLAIWLEGADMDNVHGILPAGSSSDCRLPRRVQYAGTILPNSEASQAIRRVGSGVDVDPVGPEVGCQDRRVSVHDDPPVIPDEIEKSAANAQNVVPGLLLKLDPRSHACVHKQIPIGFAVGRSV